MSSEDVLEERNGYRVRLEQDDSPEQPYDDGAWPVLRISVSRYYPNPEHLNASGSRPHDLDDTVENAVSHWQTTPSGRNWKLFEKWLRAYLGVTRVEFFSSGDYWYVAYDSAAWRKWARVTAEQIAREDPLADWRAWVEGDVYGYVIEKRVTWRPVSCAADDDVTMDTWEHVNSCWGFYGYDYAKEVALEEFEAWASEPEAESNKG
jgi:hypothetical protein